MVINVVAVVVLVFFYLVILAIGIYAAWKVKVKGHENGGLEVTLVAGRDLNTCVGVITMIATAVGGGYINGTAEEVARSGLIWTLAPFGIFLGLNIAGAFYARKMREKQYLTMLDPFQLHYGKMVVLLIYSASLMGDLLWTASILNALGSTLSVIASIQMVVAVVVSGAVAILYTAVGSIIAVAYTDIVQLAFICVGLFLSLPFIFTNPDVGMAAALADTTDDNTQLSKWLGTVPSHMWGVWVDLLIAMTFGSIPWQTYFQRVLSVRSARQAQVLSFIGALGALVLVAPPVLIGMAGNSADWSNTTFGQSPMGTDKASLILPLVIDEFTPKPVAILGLGAISAAVMSSADSSILATSAMFTRNIFGEILRPCASKRELNVVRMISVTLFGAAAIVIALTSKVIYGMFILAADIVFVIIFPQLTAVLYCPAYTNNVGAVAGFALGLVLRIGAGEPFLHIPALIQFSFYSEEDGQLFPHRTVAMLCSFFVTVAVSMLWKCVYRYILMNSDSSGGSSNVVNVVGCGDDNTCRRTNKSNCFGCCGGGCCCNSSTSNVNVDKGGERRRWRKCDDYESSTLCVLDKSGGGVVLEERVVGERRGCECEEGCLSHCHGDGGHQCYGSSYSKFDGRVDKTKYELKLLDGENGLEVEEEVKSLPMNEM